MKISRFLLVVIAAVALVAIPGCTKKNKSNSSGGNQDPPPLADGIYFGPTAPLQMNNPQYSCQMTADARGVVQMNFRIFDGSTNPPVSSVNFMIIGTLNPAESYNFGADYPNANTGAPISIKAEVLMPHYASVQSGVISFSEWPKGPGQHFRMKFNMTYGNNHSISANVVGYAR